MDIEKRNSKISQENELRKNIENVMKTKNYSQLENIVIAINELLKNIYFNNTIEFMENLNFSLKDKLLFYLKISECNNVTPTIKNELIPILIVNFINVNKEEFLNLLNNDEILNHFSDFLKSER